MRLDHLPVALQTVAFSEAGLIERDAALLVPGYVASQWGFSAAGRRMLEDFYQRLEKEASVYSLCPFQACGEYLSDSRPGATSSHGEHIAYWDRFNRIVGRVNYGVLMPRAKCLVALLDGGHAFDDGVAAEIAYFAASIGRPVFAVRSDVRGGENIATSLNPALRYFIDSGPYDGKLFEGDGAFDELVHALARFSDHLCRENS